MARGELSRFFSALDLTRPEAVRDALLEVVPVLVREYGDLASVAAAEWYEQVHPGRYLAQTVDGVDAAAVEGSVRFHAGELFKDNPVGTLEGLSGAVQRFVSYSGRQTVARNVNLDPARPRYGRVPSGSETCAFCELMASRGFVYTSRESAAFLGSRFDDFHDLCNCQIVAEWDREAHHIEGYDPDAMYDRYLSARDASGSEDPTRILSKMREMYPDLYTDGHVH